MRAEEHPHYQQESARLVAVFEAIATDLTYWLEYNPDLFVKNQIAGAFKDKQKRIARLRELNDQPYFGRIDWQAADQNAEEVFYLGKTEFTKLGIYSWRDSMVADLFYKQRTKRERGRLLLKRTFEIEKWILKTITDEFVDPSLRDTLFAEVFTDSLLVRLLKEARGNKLYDIVSTIQSEQYEIIRASDDQLLVVQGAPGSGKTSVALHRVAYLLYQHHDDNSYTPDRLLVLGPNPMFMRYVANVLPALGERRVPQTTFDKWLIEHLGSPSEVRYEPQDASLEVLIDPERPRSEKVMRYRNAQNKGSLKMAQMLDRYVEILYRDLLVGREPLVCTLYISGRQRRAERPVDKLRECLDAPEIAVLPFNQRREAAEERLFASIADELGVKGESDDRNRSALQEQIHQYFEEWRALNVSVAYRRLLRTRDLLFEAGSNIFSDWDLELLAHDAPTALTPFRFSDLAALLYLKLLLDGTEDKPYRHIVIDEAQDITPLHLKVLQRYSRDGSMTVLGDLFQGIYMHHGVRTWNELQEAIAGVTFSQENIPQSYRSTKEIIEYANAMLRRTGVPEAELARPIERPGPEPALHAFDTQAALVEALPKLVEDIQNKGWQSIAIISKSLASCRQLAAALQQAGILEFQFIDTRDAEYAGGVALVPTYLTKGLEFDAVILTDADAATYTPDTLDARLLYVALTRASHELHICRVGELSSYLNPDCEKVVCQPPMGDALTPHPVTIAEYVKHIPQINADWCVTRLARAGKLDLLQAGQIDETVLDVLVQTFASEKAEPEEESVVEPLDAASTRGIEMHVMEIETNPDGETPDEALALLQLAYGLLRNSLRKVGIPVLAEGAGQLPTEVVQMVTLKRAVDQGETVLAIPGRTTRRRALQAVDEKRKPLAESYLNHLIDHGVVAVQPNDWLQIPQGQLYPLLALSLGFPAQDWDLDLVEALPRLPLPMDLKQLVLQEVPHA